MMELYLITAGKFLCYSVVKISQSVSVYDPNESHIHPSTYSSTLRTSSKSRRFFSILYWLSCISNKLLNSGHSSFIVCGINWFGLILTIPYQVIMK
uniref:ORF95b n=1 Tax=Pinus koraiensis TaxID=88728 RepID=A4QM20_PINKO|nr:ORF95b [Pinus koraiensis]ABP35346.1 ORF95b [Pinus koraiensis]